MSDPHNTQFARNGDVHLAYQTWGEGSVDLLIVENWVHHVEMMWEQPDHARFLRRLGTFARVLSFDRRGTGLSDPVAVDHLPDLETQVADALAVLDACGSSQTAVFGVGEGALTAMLLAAMHPERCKALIVFACAARRTRAPDYPLGVPEEDLDRFLSTVADTMFADPDAQLNRLVPSRASDPSFRDFMVRYMRAAVRPGTVGHYFRQSMQSDLRAALPLIQAPTLVLQPLGDQFVPAEYARYVAEHIPNAMLVELPGADHLVFAGHSDAILDEVEEFLTGIRSGAEPDRVLATLLFTDIVGSTAKAAELGDRQWRALLDAHDATLRRELQRYNGREIDRTGDGFLMMFDGPGRAIRCASAMIDAVTELGIVIRAGVHTGECEVRADNVGGLAVHIAARVSARAGEGEILVSGTVKDLLVGSGIEFYDRGQHELKGVPGEWRLFAVKS